ncbi:hypothetical protein ACFV98_02725 [Streptomyces violascens]|uniref:hypothetical protein n=1 Tax=Streptomyces violascens TaxID=67381 RepID=UPI003660BB17
MRFDEQRQLHGRHAKPVTKRIRDRIQYGTLHRGQRLFAARIALSLGVSTADVTSAFAELSREGLLTPTYSADYFRTWVVTGKAKR